jgi:predicted ATPase/DNA-binding NarL/FixJ family response regulator
MAADASSRNAITARPNNLPAATTRFIGREQQIDEIGRLLGSSRLLTLTGSGGCGKTRLALQVAAVISELYEDGEWLVDLAVLTDAELVPQLVAQTLGVRDVPGRAVMDMVTDQLRNHVSLLILDNCEHVIGAAARLADVLLRGCPGVTILATSREPLRSPGETTWRVPSLSLPPPVGVSATLDDVLGFESVRLFVDRAQAALPGFTITPANSAAVQDICWRLDGIPLAIELAAARLRVFGIAQIAARLSDRFRMLTAGSRTAMPRQQTLQATVDWSYALLSEAERMVLRRLAVFAGGWTLEAAEAVAAGQAISAGAVLDLLAALVDKSLVAGEHHRGSMRHRLLETIRQYARERLDEAGETEAARDCHLNWSISLADECEPILRGPNAGTAMDRLEAELDNLRTALDWALQSKPDAALRLSGALGWFWWGRDYHSEGRRWLDRALAANREPTPARMKALHAAGWLAHHQRDLAEARALLEESLAIARDLGDRASVAWALHCLGRVAYFEKEPAAARSLGEQSLTVAQEVGDAALIAWAHHLLGLAAYIADDDPTARVHYERSLAIRRALRFPEGEGILLILLGLVAARQGNLVEARALYREGLTTIRELLGPWGLAMPLAALSHIAAANGQPARAVRLGATATRLSEAYQTPLIPLVEPFLAQGLDAARHALGELRYAQAWTEGQSMSPESAIAEALAVDIAPVTAAATPADHAKSTLFANLTPTELQVLRQLVGGSTTKEIAAELVVAISTVDRHITHIYTKLGARNRAEATAMAFKTGLVHTD